DGSGDGLSGTFSLVDEEGNWTRLREISTFDSLGMVYSRATEYLAMKPLEHEYKLMGMAPYAAREQAERAYDICTKYLRLSDDGLGLKNISLNWGNGLLQRMHSDFRGIRFDAVAAGVQLLHERLTVQLIRNWIRKTECRAVALGGGCFM